MQCPHFPKLKFLHRCLMSWNGAPFKTVSRSDQIKFGINCVYVTKVHVTFQPFIACSEMSSAEPLWRQKLVSPNGRVQLQRKMRTKQKMVKKFIRSRSQNVLGCKAVERGSLCLQTRETGLYRGAAVEWNERFMWRVRSNIRWVRSIIWRVRSNIWWVRSIIKTGWDQAFWGWDQASSMCLNTRHTLRLVYNVNST